MAMSDDEKILNGHDGRERLPYAHRDPAKEHDLLPRRPSETR